jgi:hypothetical protein
MRRLSPLLAALALAGCGSAPAGELPPAEGAGGPVQAAVDGGDTLAVLAPRERVLRLVDARTGRRLASAPAGVGPTHVACLGVCWVADTRGDALLVYRLESGLRLVRRLYLAGGPRKISVDRPRRRLVVTLARGGAVELPAHGRPHVLRRLRHR